ncbi:MAG: chaperone modulator CbpM [Solirubrobacteraceae bacterium]
MAARARPDRSRALARSEISLVALEALAERTGLHPDVVRRLVRLGLLEPRGGTALAPLFRARDAALLMRALRLRGDLGLNYAGAVLACELLARIEELELRLRASTADHG